MNHRRMLSRLAFALCYAVLAALSMLHRDAVTLSTLFWPPVGLTLAALMLSPPRRWYGWMALAGVLHVAAGMLVGQRPAAVATVFAFTDIAYCAAVAALWRWRTRGANTLSSLSATLWFIAFVAAGSVAGGWAAALALHAIYPGSSMDHWYVWSMACFVGSMIVAPLVLAWVRFRWRGLAEQNVLALWVGLVAAFAMLAGTTIMFNDPPRAREFVWHDGFGMSYGPLLFLAIVALSWGAAGSTLTVAGLALVASSYTMSDMGPYANIAHFNGEPLLAVQGFLGCAALLSLITTALAADRERALQRPSALTFQLETALRTSGQVAWEFRLRDRDLYWLGRLPYGIAAAQAPMALDDWLSHVHPEDQDRLRAWLNTGTESYAARRLRFRVRGEDGEYRPVEMSGSAMAGVSDRMTGLMAIPGDELVF
jgi:integral membrane sensor domain MASE1